MVSKIRYDYLRLFAAETGDGVGTKCCSESLANEVDDARDTLLAFSVEHVVVLEIIFCSSSNRSSALSPHRNTFQSAM